MESYADTKTRVFILLAAWSRKKNFELTCHLLLLILIKYVDAKEGLALSSYICLLQYYPFLLNPVGISMIPFQKNINKMRTLSVELFFFSVRPYGNATYFFCHASAVIRNTNTTFSFFLSLTPV